jgi:isovaleryl-CoA dehydrogenase
MATLHEHTKTASLRRHGLAVEAVEAIQTKIADMYVATEAARLLAYEAVHTVLQGQRASRAAAAALLFSGQTARMAADAALEIHQGSGFRRGSVVERFWRDAKLFDIGAGTKEIRRVVLARELTGRR